MTGAGSRGAVHRALATVLVAVGAGLFVHPGAGAAATPPESTAVGMAASGSTPLTVVSQTSWVAPGQAFDLRLRVEDSAVPTTQLGVSVAVYSCLTSVSAFDQSLSNPSATPISSTPTPLPLGGLPVVEGGGVELSMPVVVGNASTASGGFTIDLTTAADQCGGISGVYPVRVQLVDTATRQDIAGITTHLVYVGGGSGTQRLRVAVVLPVQTALAPSDSPTPAELLSRPSAALDPPSAAAVAAVTGLVTTLGTVSSVPVTLEASPQTLDALDDSSHSTTVAELAALAADPSVHQFASTPFAPVDASSLVGDGLSSELALQISRGAQVLDATVTHTPLGAGSPDLGAWITNDSLDGATLTQLESDGYRQVILPADSVSSPPTNGSTAEPFQISTAHGPPVTAMVSSADLSARFSGPPGDPVLAAHQLVAELAQIYYEKPNDPTPRAVVAVAPNDWSANPSFVDALLGALAVNPIIEPVTTTALFGTFAGPATCRSGCRLLSSNGGSGLPVTAIRTQRQRIDGFSSATTGPSARSVGSQLGDLVLAGESEALRPSQQAGVLENTASALDAQLAQLQVAGDRTITLTSQQGTLPITIVSNTSYPVSAVVTLTSDKLLFPNGTTQWTQRVSLQLPNNVVDVKVRARASGLFKVDVVLRSPDGGLELSSGEVDVRSTATSVVGVVLSLGAVAVLLVWWFRTSRKRRALRRADELEMTGPSPEPR
jgi:hypothetical protein